MELVIIIVAALAGFWLFFVVLKRVLRMALKLALVGALLLGLVVGALAWWWFDPLGRLSGDENRRAPARANRNSR